MRYKKSELFDEIQKRDGLQCGICHGSLKKEWEKYTEWKEEVKRSQTGAPNTKVKSKRKECNLTIDHIIPQAVLRKEPKFVYFEGWKYADIDNLQLAHQHCNIKKGATYQTKLF
jgi:5-methylcytosine-specific restriction endonuclease McrA